MADKNVKFKDAAGNYLFPVTKGGNVTNNSGEKLDGVEAGAQVNKIETVKVNGTAVPILNKSVNIPIPDTSNFVTAAEVANAIASAGCIKREMVSTLPVADIDEKTIYMVAKPDQKSGNVYDEYMYINSAWEMIGNTEIDISGLVKSSELSVVAKTGSYNDLKDKPDITCDGITATSLAGYGILDAYTKTEIDAKIITFEEVTE